MAVLLFALYSLHGVLGFSISRSIFHSTSFRHVPNRQEQMNKMNSQLCMAIQQPFNPFTARHRNSKVKWFEADLETFYAFVETQPLLTAEQEIQYGKALRMSIQVEKLRNKLQSQAGPTRLITNADLSISMNTTTDVLEKMMRYAEVSRERLLNSNLKLVLAVVSRYRTSAIPNAELIAEGTRGLSRAVLRYDYSKGFRFATYATWYVHQAVSEYVRWRKHPAKMPSRYLILFRKVKQFSTDYKLEMNRLPTVREISQALNQPQFDIMKVLSMQQYPLLIGTPVLSRDGKSEGKERTFEDLLPSVYKIPSKQTDSKDLRRDMEKMMLSNLNDVERDVLRLRLGLDDGRVKPVKEVGKRFKISWKQVRNVEKEALSKLLSSEEISSFVDNYHSV
jgi:RNA polymerase sigma factor (sigma-70 family)